MYKDYDMVPWYRKSSILSPITVAGICFGPLILGVCVVVLTGGVYYTSKNDDGTLRKWSPGNKIAAVVILLWQICAVVGYFSVGSSTPQAGVVTSAEDVDRIVREGIEKRTGKKVDSFKLTKISENKYIGEARYGSAIYDFTAEVDGMEVTWNASIRKQEAPESPPEPTKPLSQIRKDAIQMYLAIIKKDFVVAVDFVWEGEVKDAGGKAALVELYSESTLEFEKKGISIVSVDVDEPGTIIAEGGYSFAVLKTRNELKSPNGRLYGESFTLAISSDNGKTWGFVEGSGLADNASRSEFKPSIPNGLQFPIYKKPVLTKDK